MKVVDGAGDFIASHHNVYISLLKVKSLEIRYFLGLIFCQKHKSSFLISFSSKLS
jgi:hypothetical protein